MALLLAPQANAAEWRVVPTLDLRETYTDNPRLAESGSKQSDFVSEISPGVSITANGRRLKANAKYAFQYLHYARDSEDNRSFHKLDATARAELVENLVYFDGSAAISQQDLSLTGRRTIDNYVISDNRRTVRTITASPYLRHKFGKFAESELRYTHTTVDTDTDSLRSSRSDALTLTINSGSSFRTLGWGFNYNAQKNSLFAGDDIESSTIGGNLRYRLTPRFSLVAGAGYDDYDYIAAAGAPGPEGGFHTVGFSWRPTSRTSIAASAGERFFGKTYSLESSIRSRTSVWRLTYDEGITTSQSEFALNASESTSDLLNDMLRGTIVDDAARQRAVDDLIRAAGLPAKLSHSVNYLTNEFFLQKTLRASVAFTGARNTVVLTAFNTARKVQSSENSALPIPGAVALTGGDTRQTGFDASWTWRVTPLASASFNAGISDSEADLNDSENRLKVFRVALARRLGPKLAGVIELKRTEQTSNVAGNEYEENAASAFLSMKF